MGDRKKLWKRWRDKRRKGKRKECSNQGYACRILQLKFQTVTSLPSHVFPVTPPISIPCLPPCPFLNRAIGVRITKPVTLIIIIIIIIYVKLQPTQNWKMAKQTEAAVNLYEFIQYGLIILLWKNCFSLKWVLNLSESPSTYATRFKPPGFYIRGGNAAYVMQGPLVYKLYYAKTLNGQACTKICQRRFFAMGGNE